MTRFTFQTVARRFSSMVLLLLFALITACGLASALAESPADGKADNQSVAKKNSTNSLDDELLKRLDNDLLEGVDKLPAIKPTADSTKNPTPDKKPTDEKSGEDQNPFTRISRRMRDVEARIARDQSGADTQRRQKEIVDELAALIEQMKKQCQACQNPSPGGKQASQRSKVSQSAQQTGGTKPADKPSRDSTDKLRRDKVANIDPAAIRERMKEAWGNLPERIREQMMQTSVDEFLPKYELLIEKYFQRLSEDETPPP